MRLARAQMRVERESDATAGTAIRTFLIADVRGYTHFTEEHGDEAAAKLASRFAELARQGVETHGGAVIELRGDEALAVFDSARQAIRAAVHLQRAFVDETVADPTVPLAVGIGLDAGEAVPVDGGYRGGALNLAARLCGLAGPAEILASREVVHLARKVDGVAYVDRGPVQLKGLGDPVHVMRLRAEAEDSAEDMAFRRALGPLAARLAPAVPGAMARNPYKGLRPFEEGDAPDFFGRESLTEGLVDRLRDTRFLAVVGPSGSGKSSVVRAGVIPALRRGAIPGSNEWQIAGMFPGAHPLEELEAALLRIAVNPPTSLMDQLASDDHGLLRAVKRALPSDEAELLLLIDQFEELFTLLEDDAARVHFLESLEVAVADPHSRLRVVITLRADFYDRPLLYRGFAELLGSRVATVVPLSPEELERAISGPASRVDARLQDGLVAKMLADVVNEPGALPLLQYALTELFERREGSLLTLEAYEAIGGVTGALGRRAEELFGALEATGKEAARQLLLRLVTIGEGPEDTRRPVPRFELFSLDLDEKSMTEVIDSFGEARLLLFDRDSRTGVPTVEVAHEALLTAWGRFRQWIDQAREDLRVERRLAAAARDWLEAERDSSFLVGGSRLEQFETWRESSGISMTPEEREFLEASLAERDRRKQEEEAREARERALERRSILRLRALVAVLAVASLVAAAVTVFALNQRGRAEREGRASVARELAAASVATIDVDPERSILLAIEAVERTRSADGTVVPEAEDALHRAILASRALLSVSGVGGRVEWSSDGTGFVAEGPEGSLDVRDAETGKSLVSFHAHDGERPQAPVLTGMTISDDGSMLATTGDDGTLRVWDPVSGKRLGSFGGLTGNFEGRPGFAEGPSFSPDGALVAAGWPFGGADFPDEGPGEVRIVDLATGRIDRKLRPGGRPIATAFSPDGQKLAVVTYPGTVVILDLRSGDEMFAPRGLLSEVFDLDWSPNGKWIVTSNEDSTVRILDAETGRERFTLIGHTGPVRSADWSPDSTRLVTGSADGTTKVWDISESGVRELLSLSAPETRVGVLGVAFSPDGDRVIAGTLETTAVRIWDVGPSAGVEWGMFPADPDRANSVTFDRDGRLVTTGRDASVVLWNPESRRRVRTIDRLQLSSGGALSPFINALEASPDGALLAIAAGPAVEVWDLTTGKLAFTARPVGRVDDLAWSPDGGLLAALAGPEVSLLNRSGREVGLLVEEAGLEVVGVRFSPDGRLMATAGNAVDSGSRDQVKIWDREGRVVETIQTQVDALSFDPPGSRIAVAHPGGGEIWALGGGGRVAALSGGRGGILDIAYSPDGSRIAAGGVDATVRLWDAESGATALVLRGHEGPVEDIAISPDGTKLASASADGTVRVWALDINDLIRIARKELTRGLTADECRQYLHLDRCPED